jgi:hypothetical protein
MQHQKFEKQTLVLMYYQRRERCFPWLPVFPSKMYLSIIHHPRWIGQWADKGKKEAAVLLYCQ